MNGCDLTLAGARLTALPSGALWWAEERLLCVSDLHLGKSERMARRGGPLLPPYDGAETLDRLEADIRAASPRTVVCLGDSFDDLDAARGLDAGLRARIGVMQAGRRWLWIEGNHDPGPVDLGGTHLSEARLGPLVFRHIAVPGARPGEVSGHYHPSITLATRAGRLRLPCFVADAARLILPAFGTYTGGLDVTAPVLAGLFAPGARALVVSAGAVRAVPLSAAAPSRRASSAG